MTALVLAGFLLLQVVANLLFKYGSTHPDRWWPGFLLGNLLGASSIWFMMQLYQRMNPNLAMAVAGGCTFVLVQLAFLWLFDGRLAPLQWAGIAAILLGTVAATLGGAPARAAA